MGFLRVNPTSGVLVEGNVSTPFVICGANCYYLMTKHHENCQDSKPLKVLESLKGMGVNCIRTWAFADGDTPSSLQPHPCFYDETVFRSLDVIIARCRDLGMKILLDLTNFWPDYGGMAQYVRWSREKGGHPPLEDGEESHELLASYFYDDDVCQKLFQRFVKALICRKNTVTGELYCNDPTIAGYGLANEPRCYRDPGCTKHIIPTWAHNIAKLIKSLDANHLVFMDCEGFFGPSTGERYLEINPFDTSLYGTDFAQDTNSPFIDVCCIHMYPEKWLTGHDEAQTVEFMEKWIHSHIQVANMLDKPLLISEYGFLNQPTREQYFIDFAAIVLRHNNAKSKLIGTMFWQACSETYRFGDEYAIFVDSELDTDKSKTVIEELCTSLKQGYKNLNRFQSRRIQAGIDESSSTSKVTAQKMPFLKSSPESFRRKIDSAKCVLM